MLQKMTLRVMTIHPQKTAFNFVASAVQLSSCPLASASAPEQLPLQQEIQGASW
jgi:hypothetical protein